MMQPIPAAGSELHFDRRKFPEKLELRLVLSRFVLSLGS